MKAIRIAGDNRSTNGEAVVSRSLEAFGWNGYFAVVVLSSAVKIRKPAPGIFRAATEAMAVEPAACAYLGNRISKDVVGCKREGFALGIVLEPPGQPQTDSGEQTVAPDRVIHSLGEAPGHFPAAGAGRIALNGARSCRDPKMTSDPWPLISAGRFSRESS